MSHPLPAAKPPASLLKALYGIFLTLLPLSGIAADYPAQAVILQYHHVSAQTPTSTSLSPEKFQEHMAFLKESGFTVLPLEQVISALKNDGTLPDRTAVITFDDAYLSVYDQAFPLLKQLNFPFTVFISAGLVNTNSALYASWEQLREMAAAGATLANHTISHPYLLERNAAQSENDWLAWVKTEIEAAEQQISDETGQHHKLLAYPYGEYNPAIRQLVSALGYTAFGQHSGPISASSDFTALPRFPFSGIYASMNTFPVKINSLAFDFVSDQQSSVTADPAPAVELEFEKNYPLHSLTCFNNNEAMSITRLNAQEQVFRIKPTGENRSRRFRYNCTLPDSAGNSGRYYWLSIPWVNPLVAD